MQVLAFVNIALNLFTVKTAFAEIIVAQGLSL